MEVSVARIRSKEINNIIQDRWEHKFLKPKILTSGTQLWISTLTLYLLREKKKKKGESSKWRQKKAIRSQLGKIWSSSWKLREIK